MQRITPLLVIATVTLLLVATVSMVRALEWWEASPAAKERAANMTAEERAESLKPLQQALNKLELAKTNPEKYWEEVSAEQTQEVRECNALIKAVGLEQANCTTPITVDDGYTYPPNATAEEKAAIDAQEYKAWEEAGRPGEPNPYCDKVSDEYMRYGGICHDRYDISEDTGLATCNDGSHREDPEDCPDATED